MSVPTSPLTNAVSIHNRIREWLIDAHDLGDDEQCLSDTLEGLSDLKEIISAMGRRARYEEAMAEACKALIEDMRGRKARREERVEKLRAAMSWAMQESGERKIDAPDMTISLSAGRRKIVTLGEPTAFTAEQFVISETRYRWDRDALAKGLDQGDPSAMELASFANPQPVLTIRGL